MILPDIKGANLDGERVLVRVDFNVVDDNGKLKEKYRIKAAQKTIDFVLSKPGTKVALLSHLSQPGVSFKNAEKEIGEILDKEIFFVDDCVSEKVKTALNGLKNEQVLLLENVRLHKEEKESDNEFAKKLAENFDVFVNEAFGASHRDHASIAQTVGFLPSFAGFNLQKEIKELNKMRGDFEKPAVAIIGGAKIETKLPVINFFAKNYDQVLVGGKLGLEAEKQNIIFPDNVILPKDYCGQGLDVGPKTVKLFVDYVSQAKTVVWNGPLGRFEDEKFRKGTEDVVRAVAKNGVAYKIAGGGETIQFLEESGLIDEFNFVSTGGGAMLEFLSKGTLPALEALKKHV